jgi:hypothetical protein
MNTKEELVSRLKDHEDGFIERKTQGAANAQEIRKTLVAFANSVPPGRTAVFYIGVKNDGAVVGVTETDSLQKTIGDVAKNDCYPSVDYQITVLQLDRGTVLAVEVEASDKRPHFSGPAYVREGSQSKVASEELYEELISSRNGKAGHLLRHKGQPITFRPYEMDRWGRSRPVYVSECRVETCDAHVVHLYDAGSGRHFAIPLDRVTINFDPSTRRLMLEAPHA